MRGLRIVVPVLLLAAVALPAAAQTTGYTGGDVAGGAEITGKVTWTGAEPALEAFVINKNTEVCDTGGGKRASNRLVIGKGGGVANAVVYLEGVTAGKPMPTDAVTLDQEGCRYDPHILLVPKKAELSMSSSDAILHNIHMFGAAVYNIPFPDKDTVVKKMRKGGLVRIQCDAGHSWMSAYAWVISHPYYALTDESGAFTLSDVPPGKYTIKMWHESWEVAEKIEQDGVVTGYDFEDPVEQAKEVEVAAGGSASVDFSLPQ